VGPPGLLRWAPAPRGIPAQAYRWEHTDAGYGLRSVGGRGITLAPDPDMLSCGLPPATARTRCRPSRCDMHRLQPAAHGRYPGPPCPQSGNSSTDCDIARDRTYGGRARGIYSRSVLAPSLSPGCRRAFRFSDEPVFAALGLARTAREDG